MYSYIDSHDICPNTQVLKHFQGEGVPRSTLYRILARKRDNIEAERENGSGRVATKLTKSNIKRLEKMINHKDGISQRMLAKVFGCSQHYISETLRDKTNIRYRKKVKKPKRLDSQKSAVLRKCSKLVKLFQGKKIVIDDESYFGLSNFELSGNAGFYSSCIDETPDNVKSKEKSKFEPKLLVWAAISPDGISDYYIVPSGQAVDQDVYINKCLRPRLLKFIDKHYDRSQVVFWPDLASSHYAKRTTDFLKAENIEFVDELK